MIRVLNKGRPRRAAPTITLRVTKVTRSRNARPMRPSTPSKPQQQAYQYLESTPKRVTALRESASPSCTSHKYRPSLRQPQNRQAVQTPKVHWQNHHQPNSRVKTPTTPATCRRTNRVQP